MSERPAHLVDEVLPPVRARQRLGLNRVESPSGPPSWEPLDGDHSGVGERLELRVSRHHDTPVVLSGDDGEGIGIRYREPSFDVSRCQHCRP